MGEPAGARVLVELEVVARPVVAVAQLEETAAARVAVAPERRH